MVYGKSSPPNFSSFPLLEIVARHGFPPPFFFSWRALLAFDVGGTILFSFFSPRMVFFFLFFFPF